ncbi:GntR family transcriptional regulator [Defluviimonas sp. SAOS-178_SWC]|uniref:GntR family transcriptional regulator n=1 Tax=Defluviimonas sp. SAOS-178_SWC TaxID=3121287 RepID=UPI003221D170
MSIGDHKSAFISGESADWHQPLQRENLSEMAYVAVRDAMMRGLLKPGQKLQLRPLSAKFGISMTPMREALLRLVSKDVLSLDLRGTVIVPVLTRDALAEIHQVRIMLEGRAAYVAASQPAAGAADDLMRIHQQLVAAQENGDFEAAVKLNTDFHLGICKAAKLTVIHEVVEMMWMRCGPILSHLYDGGAPFSDDHPHLKLIEAIGAGDPDMARQAIEEDIIRGGEKLYKWAK